MCTAGARVHHQDRANIIDLPEKGNEISQYLNPAFEYRQSVPPGVGLFNGGAVAAFRPVVKIHVASTSWLYFLWSAATLLSLPLSSRC